MAEVSTIKTIEVGNVMSFLNAIDSNTHIKLKSGTYSLSSVCQVFDSSKMKYFSQVFDGDELNLEGITNLTIEAERPQSLQ